MGSMGVGQRIYAAMEKAGKRPVDIARHLGIEDAAVHQWFKKDSPPASKRIPDLARFLGVSTDYLMNEPSPNDDYSNLTKEVQAASATSILTAVEDFKRTVPVTETAQPGSSGGDFSMGHVSTVMVRRPPKLDKRTDIIAFYVNGGGAPRYDVGDLIYCERAIPAGTGDYAVVQLKSGACYLRKVIDRSLECIQLVTHGSRDPLEIPMAKIVRILRVMTTKDLLG